MKKKAQSDIDLEYALPGQLFVLRDGNPVEFRGKLVSGAPGSAQYLFQSAHEGTPFQCFRTRDGRLSSTQTNADGRDIAARIAPNLEEHDIGQHYQLRNGAVEWLQQILPNPTVPFRWVVGGRFYRENGTHLLDGGPSPFDIVIVKPPPTEEKKQTTEEPEQKINLAELPLGTEFLRQDGELVMLVSKEGKQKQWPYTVGKDTYAVNGRYMSDNQPNLKDLKEVIYRKKKTPLSRAQILLAFRELAKQQSKATCEKINNLLACLESTPS